MRHACARRVGLVMLVGVLVLAPFFALAVSSSAFASSYTFTTIDVGVVATQVFGINDSGQISGQFRVPGGSEYQGFLRDTDGAITTFAVPGAFSTFAFGINTTGQIVGQAQYGAAPYLGFLRDTSGTVTTFQVPGSALTQAHGINASGQIVGFFTAPSEAHGFLYSGGVFTTIDVPGATSTNVAARGINDAGQIVGTFNDTTLAPLPFPLGSTPRGFLYSGGVFTTLDAPGASETFAYGINTAGQIVGTFVDPTGVHGFLNISGVFTTLDVPGANHTDAWGINGRGQIVGWFLDATGVHGFLATPVNASPVCSAAQAFPAVLGSPNHQFVPIVVMGVTDPDGDAVIITVTGVTQDEPVNAKGDGNTSPDAVIQVGAASVRAERSGKGNGRVYQVSFKAEDDKDGSCTSAVTVSVPHSMKVGLTAIDDGQGYDSTVP